MRKKYLITIVVIVFIVLISALILHRRAYIKSFSLEDYSEIIAESSRNEEYEEYGEYGEVNTAQEAITIAKQFWDKHYNHLSCSVFYDNANRVWLVKGNKFFIIPSGPYIIISEEDGKVLAFGDYKF